MFCRKINFSASVLLKDKLQFFLLLSCGLQHTDDSVVVIYVLEADKSAAGRIR
jgi:hypothetical protein